MINLPVDKVMRPIMDVSNLAFETIKGIDFQSYFDSIGAFFSKNSSIVFQIGKVAVTDLAMSTLFIPALPVHFLLFTLPPIVQFLDYEFFVSGENRHQTVLAQKIRIDYANFKKLELDDPEYAEKKTKMQASLKEYRDQLNTRVRSSVYRIIFSGSMGAYEQIFSLALFQHYPIFKEISDQLEQAISIISSFCWIPQPVKWFAPLLSELQQVPEIVYHSLFHFQLFSDLLKLIIYSYSIFIRILPMYNQFGNLYLSWFIYSGGLAITLPTILLAITSYQKVREIYDSGLESLSVPRLNKDNEYVLEDVTISKMFHELKDKLLEMVQTIITFLQELYEQRFEIAEDLRFFFYTMLERIQQGIELFLSILNPLHNR